MSADHGGGHHDGYGPKSPPIYHFEYGVRDDKYGARYGHREARKDKQTEGEYYVDLPDGRKKTVSYKVDGYSGE